MNTALILGIAFVLVVFAIISYFMRFYNRVKKSALRVEEAFSGVDTYLEERFDMLTKMASTVKEEARTEVDLQTEVTKVRSKYDIAKTISEKIDAVNNIERLMPLFQATRENYPDTKFNEGFRQMQRGILQIEDKISAARRNYNTSVRQHNELIVVFPANIISGMFNFDAYPMFEATEHKREDIDLDEIWAK